MVAAASNFVAIGVGVWMVGLSLFMLAAPRRTLGLLAVMGGTAAIHFGEMAARLSAGAALILAAPGSRGPISIAAVGWFLATSALVLMMLPRGWHGTFSAWWSKRIPVVAVRCLAVPGCGAGGLLIWALV